MTQPDLAPPDAGPGDGLAPRSARRADRRLVALVVAGAVVVTGAVALLATGGGPLGRPDCVADVDGHRVELDRPDADALARTAARLGAEGRSRGRIAARLERAGQGDDDAAALAAVFTGRAQAAFACSVPGDAEASDPTLTADGLTTRAEAVRRDVEEVFGEQSLGGFAPGGVSTGHIPGSAHYEGRAVDIFFRPVNRANRADGWAVAQYLVAAAERLDVATVIFDDRIWVAGKDDAWRDYDAPDRPGDVAILEHRDHVHVDVFR